MRFDTVLSEGDGQFVRGVWLIGRGRPYRGARESRKRILTNNNNNNNTLIIIVTPESWDAGGGRHGMQLAPAHARRGAMPSSSCWLGPSPTHYSVTDTPIHPPFGTDIPDILPDSSSSVRKNTEAFDGCTDGDPAPGPHPVRVADRGIGGDRSVPWECRPGPCGQPRWLRAGGRGRARNGNVQCSGPRACTQPPPGFEGADTHCVAWSYGLHSPVALKRFARRSHPRRREGAGPW